MKSPTTRIPDRSPGKPSNWPKDLIKRGLKLATNADMNLREIAEMLGVPHPTVRGWVMREKKRQKAREAPALHGEGLSDSGAITPPQSNTGDAE